MTSPHRRAWWRRKRWITAAALWSLLAYPLSAGPVFYRAERGVTPRWIGIAYRPIWDFDYGLMWWPVVGDYYCDYLELWGVETSL